MNIIEAIKSRKKFRRKGWTEYYDLKERPDLYFVIDEIMAGDWEVEEKKVEITLSQFQAKYKSAWSKFYTKCNNNIFRTSSHSNNFEEYLKEELGL